MKEQFDRVYALVRSDEAAARARGYGVTPILCDLSDPATPELRATHFLHMAGIHFAQGAIRLAESSRARRFVAISSASAVAAHHPNREWVLESERWVTSAFPNAAILRPTMIFGAPRDRSIRRLRSALHKLPAVPHFTGGGRIMPVFADDLASAIAESFERPLTGIKPVGGPNPIGFGELVDTMAEIDTLRRLAITIPVPWVSTLASLTGSRGSAVHALQMLSSDRVVPTPTNAGFSYEPTPLRNALQIAFKRYR